MTDVAVKLHDAMFHQAGCVCCTQVCGKPVTTTNGRCLRPDTGRVILHLKDINLPRWVRQPLPEHLVDVDVHAMDYVVNKASIVSSSGP